MADMHLSKRQEREIFAKALLGSPFFTIFASVLTTFVVAAIFLKVGGGVPLNVTQTTTEKASTFDVTSEGVATVTPDEAVVVFGVVESASTVSQAQERVNATISRLRDRLEELGVAEDKIKTLSYDVYPEYDFSLGRRVSGYQVSARLEVSFSDFDIVNQALDLAGELGLNQTGGLTFRLSDEAEEKARSIARAEAVKQAKKKAEELADLAGLRLGKVVNVSEVLIGGPIPYFLETEGRAEDVIATPTEVTPGTSEVHVSVTLSYETR